jgi:osomolarity two-component system response regulator SSK1
LEKSRSEASADDNNTRPRTASVSIGDDTSSLDHKSASPSDTLASSNTGARLPKIDSDVQLPPPLRVDFDDIPEIPPCLTVEPATPNHLVGHPIG